MKIILPLLLFISAYLLQAQNLYYINGLNTSLIKIPLAGGINSTISSAVNSGFQIVVKESTDDCFYTDMANKSVKKVTGAGVISTIFSSVTEIPRGIALNDADDYIYWSDNYTGRIKRMHTNGTSVSDYITGLSSPGALAYDPINKFLYWMDNGTDVKKISRKSVLTDSVFDFVTGITDGWGIALDVPGGYLYWADNGAGFIYRKQINSPYAEAPYLSTSGESIKGLFINSQSGLLYRSVFDPGTSTGYVKTGATTVVDNAGYPQAIAMDWNYALPVELTSFTVKVKADKVQLSWQTKSEVNLNSFIIQKRSSNEKVWSDEGEIRGKGNTNTPSSYTYEVPFSGSSLYSYYRIKMVDNDGSSAYSNEVLAELPLPDNFALNQNYPNPFNPATNISYRIKEKTSVDLKLYDASGSLVAVLVNGEKEPGYYNYVLDSKKENLSSGVYFYRLTAGSSFTAVKKLILMK